MSADILSKYAVGGARRPDSFTGMNPRFVSALGQMFTSAPPDIQSQMRFSSGYRSPAVQAALYKAALAKYGSPEAARKWVAPPGNSQHNHGHAADMKWLSPTAMQWAHANAAKFGLAFPLKHENWHIELADARGAMPRPAQNPSAPVAAAAPAQGFTPPQAGAMPFNGPDGTNPLGQALMNFQPLMAQNGQADAERKLAEKQRRQALFGAGGVADLYG